MQHSLLIRDADVRHQSSFVDSKNKNLVTLATHAFLFQTAALYSEGALLTFCSLQLIEILRRIQVFIGTSCLCLCTAT